VRAYLFAVIAVVAAVPVIVLGGVQAQRSVAVEAARTDRATLALSRSLAHQLAQEMLGHLKSVEVLAEQLRGHLDPDGVKAVGRAHAISHPEDTGVAVVDARGAALLNVMADGELPKSGGNYADRPYFQRALATRRAFISPQVIVGRVTGVPNVHAVAPVLGDAGQVAGVAIASIDLRPIGAEASAVASGVDDGRVVVVDARGRLIADSDDVQPRLRDVSSSALFGPITGGTDARIGSDDRGRPARASAVAVDFGDLGWRVVALRTTASIERQRAVVRRQAALISLLALLAALASAGVVAGWLSRPVRSLAVAAEAVGQGDFSRIPARADGGPAEIVNLTNAVRSMVEGLRAHGDELLRLNATLEQKVQDRTLELTRRGRDMRLMLDNVAQGFLTIDAQGRLAQERSAIVDRWFGAYAEGATFAGYAGAVDAEFGSQFQLSHEAYVEGILPRDLCLDQLPTRLRGAGRDYRCAYSPLEEGPAGALLIVISDVTEQLIVAEKDAEQRDVLAFFHGLVRDRGGYLAFFEEADRIVAGTNAKEGDLATVKRLLHTLKGNAGMVDLHVLADLCHRAEDDLEEAQDLSPGGALAKMHAHWQMLSRTLRPLLGTGDAGTLEIEAAEIDRLCEEIARGASPASILARLAYLRLEPVERPLGRLGRYAREIAQRLGKGEIDVVVDAAGVRLGPRRWTPLWADLVHLVRNAVDHGFETPDERRALGKPPRPRLRLAAAVEGGRLKLQITDDGRGVDWNGVRRIAEARALPARTEADLVAALLSPGFSTRHEVSATSGRGVGLAAVHARVRELGGAITVDSRPGAGARWSLSFPASSGGEPDAMARPEPAGAPSALDDPRGPRRPDQPAA
jgi:C4-dicarboxylate-specific signal transduction histidine kinase/HPt (histidine-containing phosphotransfer) domain-containing protein